MNVPLVLAGVLLLFLGRRLFWLFVGLTGFVVGFALGQRLDLAQTQLMALLIAVGVGVIGIVLAIFLQRVAIAVAGFFSGGYLGLAIANQLARTPASSEWIFFLVAGILGAILLTVFFDWALIFLSSITGAVLVARGIPIPGDVSLLAIAALFVFGFLVQAGWHRRRRLTAET
jgi:hypothetical protein